MDNRQLSYFRAVYEKRSFTKAAESIFISPQGINKAVHQLENELGVPLFEQTAIGLTPTAYGEYLYTHAGPYVELHEQLLTGMEELRSRNTMTINLRMSTGRCNILPPHFFTDFMALHPQVHVNFFSYSDDKCNQVLRTTNDGIGLCSSTQDIEGYVRTYTEQRRMFLIVGKDHPFAQRKTLRFSELKNETIINHPFTNTQAGQKTHFDRLGIIPQIILGPADRALTMDLVARGHAVSFYAGDYYKQFPICRVDFEDFEEYFCWSVFVPKNKLDNPAVKLFVQYVHDQLDVAPNPPDPKVFDPL